MDSKEITAILGRQLFESGHSPICANFQTIAMNECDIISVNSGGNLCEFEIKVSASDFKADFKKVAKHHMLEHGPYVKVSKKGEVTHLGCSYFTYVCPACLIREDQVPKYAGLIWIHADGRIDHKIKAPQLHKHRADASIIKKIAHNLTQKALFGISHMTMVQRENKERIDEYKKDQRMTQFNMMLRMAQNKPLEFQKLMIDDKYKKLYEAAKAEFPEEYKRRADWKGPEKPKITTPITTPKPVDNKPVAPKKEEPIPTPAPETGKRRLVKKSGRPRR